MKALMNYEKETILNFNEEDKMASVFTYNAAWQRHLEDRLGFQPVMDNGDGGKEYSIPKNLIKPPRAPRKLSAEQREVISTRLAKYRSLPKQAIVDVLSTQHSVRKKGKLKTR